MYKVNLYARCERSALSSTLLSSAQFLLVDVIMANHILPRAYPSGSNNPHSNQVLDGFFLPPLVTFSAFISPFSLCSCYENKNRIRLCAAFHTTWLMLFGCFTQSTRFVQLLPRSCQRAFQPSSSIRSAALFSRKHQYSNARLAY